MAEEFGNAQVAFDKFPVVSQVNAALDEVRRREVRTDSVARTQLEKTHWLWRKNPEGWTAKEAARWEQLKDKPLVTGLAYAMRLELHGRMRAGRRRWRGHALRRGVSGCGKKRTRWATDSWSRCGRRRR